MLIGERADVLRVREHVVPFFEALGIVMKVEDTIDMFEKVSFCQTQPVYDGLNWRAVREPSASLTKDCTLVQRPPIGSDLKRVVHFKQMLDSIGQCGLALTNGIPVLQSYYRAMVRNGLKGGRPTEAFIESGFYRLSRGLTAQEDAVISPAARVSFYRAFGVVPDVQRKWNAIMMR